MWHSLLAVDDLVLELLNFTYCCILKCVEGCFKDVTKNIMS